MINILALALLASSLAAAGVWSPSPPPTIREPRRVIVVEYDEHQIPSPPTHKLPHDSDEPDNPTTTHSAEEAIHDAYGSFKKKTSDVEHLLEKGKEKITDKADQLRQQAQDKFEEEKEKISDKISDGEHLIKEGKEKIIDMASHLKEDTVKGIEDVVGNLSRISDRFHRHLFDVMRRAKEYAVSKEVGKSVGATAHLMAFAVAYGTGVWVTFVSSHVMATALPRQQFGVVQSKMYPVYFRVVACGVGVAALAQLFGKGNVVGAERVQGYHLLGALGLVLVNMMYLEPKATKVMFEIMKMEKEEGRGRDMADIITEPVVTTSTATTTTATPVNVDKSMRTTFGIAARTTAKTDQEAIKNRAVKLSKRLKKLNTNSSFLNLLSLMGLTWHLVHLAGQMQCS